MQSDDPSSQSPTSQANHLELLDHDSDDHSDEMQGVEAHHGKRKRPLSASCELCKQRKVKCDRAQPSCGWCARNGATCEYRARRKPGLRANYGRNLERRLDGLEEILRRHEEFINHRLRRPSALDHPSSWGVPNLLSDSGTPQERVLQVSQTEPLMAQQTFQVRQSLGLTSTEHRNVPRSLREAGAASDAAGTGLPVSASSQISDGSGMSAAAQDYYGTARLNVHSPSAPLPECFVNQDQDMPPYDLLYALVDLYFKHINTWCPILHRKTTLQSLFGPSTLHESDSILIHAIVVTTMRFSTDTRLTEERRKHYREFSKQRVLLYGIENSSVKSLQALVILALDILGSSNGPPGWNIMALITRSVVQLGLAVESTSTSVSPQFASIYTLRAMTLSEPCDFVEDEARRRLFWMIYLLDRYATVATAFEFALAENEIDRLLPCRDDLWIKNETVETRWFKSEEHEEAQDRPENLGSFAYHVEIMHIISNIHQFLKRPVDIGALGDVEQWQRRYRELDSALSNWRYNLPPDMRNMAHVMQSNGKNPRLGWIMVHATYHTAIIRLHSSAAYPTTRSPIFTPSYSASQQCHSAAENIAAIGEFVMKNDVLSRLGPPFAFTLWVAARVLLVHSSTVEHELAPQIFFFVDMLREMGAYWEVARRYCALLGRVLEEHHDSARRPDSITPSSVKILADMRRTAFDLDFLISRQPWQGGFSTTSRLPSAAPNGTPAPNDLEYLDVFDFFNLPRLPVGSENTLAGFGQTVEGPNLGTQPDPHEAMLNEYNIHNFAMDASSDWLFKPDRPDLAAQS